MELNGKTKILFLDIDGVMNCSEYSKYRYVMKKPDMMCRSFAPHSVRALNLLMKDKDISIVISSTWRKYWDLEDLKVHFQKQGFSYPDRIIGFTPVSDKMKRGEEIENWLVSNPCNNFVIFDDDSDMGRIRKYLVQTSNKYGLTMTEIKCARKLFNEQEQAEKRSCETGRGICRISPQAFGEQEFSSQRIKG